MVLVLLIDFSLKHSLCSCSLGLGHSQYLCLSPPWQPNSALYLWAGFWQERISSLCSSIRFLLCMDAGTYVWMAFLLLLVQRRMSRNSGSFFGLYSRRFFCPFLRVHGFYLYSPNRSSASFPGFWKYMTFLPYPNDLGCLLNMREGSREVDQV